MHYFYTFILQRILQVQWCYRTCSSSGFYFAEFHFETLAFARVILGKIGVFWVDGRL